MGEIDLGYSEIDYTFYGTDVNRLKKYSDKYIYVLLGMTSVDDTPITVIAVEYYTEINKVAKAHNLFEISDYVVLIWAKPQDPTAFVVDKEPEMSVWVLTDPLLSGFEKCANTYVAARHIERMVDPKNSPVCAINDIVVLIGKELDWPKDDDEKLEIGKV